MTLALNLGRKPKKPVKPEMGGPQAKVITASTCDLMLKFGQNRAQILKLFQIFNLLDGV
jgi:hypothetical protein